MVELYESSTQSFNVTGRAVSLTSVESAILLNDGRVFGHGKSRELSAPHPWLPKAMPRSINTQIDDMYERVEKVSFTGSVTLRMDGPIDRRA